MFWRWLALLISFYASCVDAQGTQSSSSSEPPKLINQVLFYESKQSWTSRDFELFNRLKKEVLKKERLSSFTETAEEDFLLSRLSAREALLFEVRPTPTVLTEASLKQLSEFSSREINEELRQIGLAQSMIRLKEEQLGQKLRFRTWFDLLKRKYQVKLKSFDFKLSHEH